MSHCLPLSLKQYFCRYWCHGLSFVLSAVDLTVLLLCFTCHIVFEAILLQILVPWFVFCVVCCRLDSTDTMFYMSHHQLMSLNQYFFQTPMPWFIFCVVCYRLDSTDTMFHMSRSVIAFETVLFQIFMPCVSHAVSSAVVF